MKLAVTAISQALVTTESLDTTSKMPYHEPTRRARQECTEEVKIYRKVAKMYRGGKDVQRGGKGVYRGGKGVYRGDKMYREEAKMYREEARCTERKQDVQRGSKMYREEARCTERKQDVQRGSKMHREEARCTERKQRCTEEVKMYKEVVNMHGEQRANGTIMQAEGWRDGVPMSWARSATGRRKRVTNL